MKTKRAKQYKTVDLTDAFNKYKGLWVAFTKAYKVISADKDIRKAHDSAIKKGYKRPIMFKMPLENTFFIS